ncbi:MAG: thiolase family protein [Proteobacteria bacterium]|nr:thiolase family protein [Pseudomonadota bacterium]
MAAIVGLGFSAISRKPIGSARALAATAVRAAIDDAGLRLGDMDGLLLNPSSLAAEDALPLKLQEDIGLRDLHLLAIIDAKGSAVVQMVQQATMAIGAGLAQCVACVFADTPVVPQRGAGDTFAITSPITGIAGWERQYGLFGATGAYALAARRHMALHGWSGDDLGAYVLACRRWAALHPAAALRAPLTMEQYRAAPWVVEPFRLLDCAYPMNGAAAVVVTDAARAADAQPKPVYVHGMGQGHPGGHPCRPVAGDGADPGSGGALAAEGAYRMAGIGPADVTLCELYDSFSFTALLALEEYGFCGPGEAARFVADGHTAPGGRLPLNTGGGHLAGGYLQGMTPLAEAVVQGRGAGGARQVPQPDAILVNGSGGWLEHHAALVLSPHRGLN